MTHMETTLFQRRRLFFQVNGAHCSCSHIHSLNPRDVVTLNRTRSGLAHTMIHVLSSSSSPVNLRDVQQPLNILKICQWKFWTFWTPASTLQLERGAERVKFIYSKMSLPPLSFSLKTMNNERTLGKQYLLHNVRILQFEFGFWEQNLQIDFDRLTHFVGVRPDSHHDHATGASGLSAHWQRLLSITHPSPWI